MLDELKSAGFERDKGVNRGPLLQLNLHLDDVVRAVAKVELAQYSVIEVRQIERPALLLLDQFLP